MPISSAILAIGQLAVASLPLVDVTTKIRPTVNPYVPGEPSTLALAVIGISLMAAYVVVTRRLQTKRETRQVSTPKHAGSRRKAA